jgi:predicted  nucleic acid-binding Zn-ribbon protein
VLQEIDSVLKLQSMDLRMAALRKEVATLPKQIAAIEKTLESHQRKLEADQATLVASQKERRQLDGEIQTQRQKISKLRDQMLGAKTNEQYRAFQNEIEFCEQAIRKCEDRILELMMEAEALEQNVKRADEALKKEKVEVDRQKAVAQQRTAVDQKQLDELSVERGAMVKGISPSLLGSYDRLSKKYNGLAASDASNGRCSACQLELRPQLFQELRRGDKVLLCENCRRILYYNPPVDFDPANGGPAPSDRGASGEGTRVDMT